MLIRRSLIWVPFVITCVAKVPTETTDAPLQWLHDCSSCDKTRSKVLRWTIGSNDAFAQTCIQRCVEDPECTHVQVKPDRWGAGCFLYNRCVPVPNSCDEWHVYAKPVLGMQNQNDIGRCPALDCGPHCTVKYDFFGRDIFGKATFFCESGYILSGNPSLTCKLNVEKGYATWSGTTPRCEDSHKTTTPSPHPGPSPGQHMVFVGNGNCAGDKGRWDDRDFVQIANVDQDMCEAACIGDGDRCTGYSYHRSHKSSCFLWHQAITHVRGSRRVQCYAKAACPVIDNCGPHCSIDVPGDVPVMLEGAKLYFRCDRGYKLVGESDTLVCAWIDAKARWNSPTPRCVEAPLKPCKSTSDCPAKKTRCLHGRCVPDTDFDTCMPLPGGNHLTVTYSSNGLTATYHCAQGYTVSNERISRHCDTATLSWKPNAPPPLCVKEGMLVLGRGKCVNKKAHWSHHEYTLVRNIESSAECENRCAHDWRCHACSYGDASENCFLWHAPVVRGDGALEYQCLQKYACATLHGKHLKVKYVLPRERVESGLESRAPLSAGTVATFTCTSPKYTLSDTDERRCLGDTWDAPPPRCDERGAFWRVGHGKCQSKDHEWRPLEQVRARRGTCAESCLGNKRCTGYAFVAHENKCVQYLDYVVDHTVADGRLEECFAKKLPRGCPPLDRYVEHGSWETRHPGDRRIGTVVHLKCDKGYEPTRSGIAQCNLDFVWEAPEGRDFSFCKAQKTTTCGPVPRDAHGSWKVISEDYEPGSVAELECEKNYCKNGAGYLLCTLDSKWSLSHDVREMPACKPCQVQRFNVTSGNCVADKKGCVWSRSDDCKFVARTNGLLTVREWKVRGASLFAHGARFTSDNSPDGLTFFKGDEFYWRARLGDYSSFEVCWKNLKNNNAFLVMSGACLGNDACVSSPHFPNSTHSHEECTIEAKTAGNLEVKDMSESAGSDLLVKGDLLPMGKELEMKNGDIIRWKARGDSKWKLCIKQKGGGGSDADISFVQGIIMVVVFFGMTMLIAYIAQCTEHV